jgi:alpha-glucosidase
LAFEDLRDPYGLANWPQNPGRDGCRTPFPWNAAAPHHGFSTASRTWLPVDPSHAPLAVDRQLEDPTSTLHATRRLLALRREYAALRVGGLEVLVSEGDVLVLRRHCAGAAEANAGEVTTADSIPSEALLLAFNLGTAEATIPLPVGLAIANGHTPLFVHAGAELKGTHLHLPPGAALQGVHLHLPPGAALYLSLV